MKTLKIFGKLTIVGCVIVGIGAAFLALSPKGEVEEANADISNLLPYDSWEGRSYSKVMADSGLNIRAYDMNGNTMYFGIGNSPKRPKEVLKDLQEAFVTAKINERAYLDVPQALYTESTDDLAQRGLAPTTQEFQYLEGMVTGEIVPLRVTDNRVVMGGMMPEAGAQPGIESLFEAIGNEQTNASGPFKGFRYLEAREDPRTGDTIVESTWADEDFDWRKMEVPDKYADLEQGEVRRCPGCKTEIAMKSLSPGEDYRAQQFQSHTPTANLVDFYDTTLGEQGWERVRAESMLEQLETEQGFRIRDDVRRLEYFQGDKWKSILLSPTNDGRGGTSVTAIEAD